MLHYLFALLGNQRLCVSRRIDACRNKIPVRHACVEHLAAVKIGKAHRTGAGKPAFVRADAGRGAVGIGKRHLCDDGGVPRLGAFFSGVVLDNFAVIPALGNRHIKRVCAACKKMRDVVALILVALLINRPAGGENEIAHASAADFGIVYALGSDVERGAHKPRADFKFFAENRAYAALRGKIRFDPCLNC